MIHLNVDHSSFSMGDGQGGNSASDLTVPGVSVINAQRSHTLEPADGEVEFRLVEDLSSHVSVLGVSSNRLYGLYFDELRRRFRFKWLKVKFAHFFSDIGFFVRVGMTGVDFNNGIVDPGRLTISIDTDEIVDRIFNLLFKLGIYNYNVEKVVQEV